MPYPFGATTSVMIAVFDALEQVHGPRVAVPEAMSVLHDCLSKAEDVWQSMPQAGLQPAAEQVREAA